LSIPVIAFFNNKGGVGKTSLVYHLTWMYADLGLRVLAADLDPQANLTAAFFDEEELEQFWERDRSTVASCVDPLIQGTGDVSEAEAQPVTSQLALLVGDLLLSGFEDQLSEVWPKCQDRDPRAFRVMRAFWKIIHDAARAHEANLVLMDLGPNLGAINRAALIAADYVVVPLSPDLFSLQGLKNLGPALKRWRSEWSERVSKNPANDLPLPEGSMQPVGYVVLQHSVRLDRPVKAYDRWIAKIPETYWRYVLGEAPPQYLTLAQDEECLSLLKHYRSLMPLAQEARKPMFHLKAADGAIGSHLSAVQSAYEDFKRLAYRIAGRIGLSMPGQD